MSATDPKFNPSENEDVKLIKELVVEMERYILDNIKDGRRRSISLDKLEDFSMWAVKAAVVGDA